MELVLCALRRGVMTLTAICWKILIILLKFTLDKTFLNFTILSQKIPLFYYTRKFERNIFTPYKIIFSVIEI